MTSPVRPKEERPVPAVLRDKATHWTRAKVAAYHMSRDSRGWRDRVVFKARDKVSFTLAVVSRISLLVGVVGAIGIIQRPSLFKIGLVAASLLSFVLTYFRTFSENLQREVSNNSPGYASFVALLSRKNRDTETTIFADDAKRDHGLLYASVIPEQIMNPIRIERTRFDIPDKVEKHADALVAAEGKGVVNEGKIRLVTDLNDLAPDEPVILQRTCYFHDRVTNNLAKKVVSLGGETLSGHTFMVDGDNLIALRNSADLSNQIGGSTILVTADAKLVYVEQGSRARENPSRFASSGSGSFDWPKLVSYARDNPNGSFADFARTEIERELTEEIGVDLSVDHRTFLVGYGRYLYRNGKPELFGLTATKQQFRELRVRYQESSFIRKELRSHNTDGLDGRSVRIALSDLLRRLQAESRGTSRLSVPLAMNIRSATNFLDAEGASGQDRLGSFFGVGAIK